MSCVCRQRQEEGRSDSEEEELDGSESVSGSEDDDVDEDDDGDENDDNGENHLIILL